MRALLAGRTFTFTPKSRLQLLAAHRPPPQQLRPGRQYRFPVLIDQVVRVVHEPSNISFEVIHRLVFFASPDSRKRLLEFSVHFLWNRIVHGRAVER